MQDNQERNFFNTNKCKEELDRFISELKAYNPADSFEKNRNSHILEIIDGMRKAPDSWDKNCAVNIKWIGDNFLSVLARANRPRSKEDLNDIFSICWRFLLEYYLSVPGDLWPDYNKAYKFALSEIDNFDEHSKNQLEFAYREMPIGMLKELYSNGAIQSLRECDSITLQAKKQIEDITTSLNQYVEKTENLKSNLEKYTTAYNFVGLHKGFDDLHKEKRKEKNILLGAIIVLGVAIPIPIWVKYQNTISMSAEVISTFAQTPWFTTLLYVPILSIVGILLYYFKIILGNYNSVKSQILQIELRKTLCRFIQSYAEYSTEIKQKDREALNLFEKIIFSGIVADEGRIPTAFDGVEQLGNLINKIKPK